MIDENVRTAIQRIADELVGENQPVSLVYNTPPKNVSADVSMPCFALAKAADRDLSTVASSLAVKASVLPGISTSVSGGYVNLELDTSLITQSLLAGVHITPAAIAKKIMVEYLSPNTNKPLHLGHVRNGVIGVAVSGLLDAVGHTVVRACLYNDRGVHICKSMYAWEYFLDAATPESRDQKPDHLVGDCYVRFNVEAEDNPELEAAAEAMLLAWEQNDPAIRAVWEQMNDWVYVGHDETMRRYGFEFDCMYYESLTYQSGKDLVQAGLQKGVFAPALDGGVEYPLTTEQFAGLEPEKKRATVLRPDGTSVYVTQDIGTAVAKAVEHDLDASVYVVAEEQNHHFKVLFQILFDLGYDWAFGNHHLSYGMVNLPDGRMKSREGKKVDADTLLDDMAAAAKAELQTRVTEASIPPAALARRAEVIALAAIKFYLLLPAPQRSMRFDSKKSLSFKGDTGPYCLYALARMCGVLRQFDHALPESPDMLSRAYENASARRLALQLAACNEMVTEAALVYDPSILAQYTLELAKAANDFYTNCRIGAEVDETVQQSWRVLAQLTVATLQRCFEILGVQYLDEM